MNKLKRKLQLIPVLLTGCIFFFSLSIKAQHRDNVWCFGDSAGLNFTQLHPSAYSTPLFTTESSASISDEIGTLLMFSGSDQPGSNVCKVFSYDHSLMENGDSILSLMTYTNGMTIIPSPESNSLFYLVGQDYNFSLRYSIIDLSYNNGKGKVVKKNILLSSDTIAEKISAVRHGNGRDWWIITHQLPFTINPTGSSQAYLIYKITPEGVFGPVRQEIGTIFSFHPSGNFGEIVISKSGDKVALMGVNYLNMAGFDARSIIDVFDFDRCSGQLSNWINLGADQDWNKFIYGGSFSSDGTKLYVSDKKNLYQYDLTSTNILASKKQIWNVVHSEHQIGQHQLAPDNRIYIVVLNEQNKEDSVNAYLSYISYPDSAGVSCGFTYAGVSLGSGRVLAGLPNNPNYQLGALTGSLCDTLQKEEVEIPIPSVVFPNVFSPNEDGTNDTWYPYSTGIMSMDFTIFSRWGTVVYTESSSSGREDGLLLQGWNGYSMNGEESTEGVYYFIANWKDRDGVEGNKNGMIQLLR